MRVVIGYCDKDEDQSARLASWMASLGPYPGHSLFVARDISSNIRPFANIGFDKVDEIEITNDAWRHWPESCNNVFGIACRHISELMGGEPFLWLEPDVVPLRPGWLNSIAMEYEKCGRPFLGDFVSVHTPELDVPDHMSGVAVYPGNMTQNAGMALISHEIAWDVAAAYQIVPRMATSKLILHIWNHPPFDSFDSIQSGVYAHKPECVLFHRDKTGSLIDLLRQQKAGVVGLAPASAASSSAVVVEQPATPVCDILIKSYPPDYERLGYCLRSLWKFAHGFRNIVLIVPHGTQNSLPKNAPQAIPVVEFGEGYMYQQALKANAHEFTDAEYVLHIDSDTMLTRPITPLTFMNEGKPWWLYTPYSEIVCPWQKITEKFMDEPLDYEFMRRLPLFIPRWLHEETAKFCLERHKMRLTDYIMTQSHRAFSEFNALGALAWTRFKDKFQWINTTTEPMPDTCAIQRWSGDAFDDGIKAKCEEILNGSRNGDSDHGTLGIKTLELEETASTLRNGENSPSVQTLSKRQAAMARARAALAVKRASGWRPKLRGKSRKKRKEKA